VRGAGDDAHAGQRERGALPGILMVDLGHRDLKAAPELLLETLEGATLALQRPHIGQVDLHRPHRHPRRRHRLVDRAELERPGDLLGREGLDDVVRRHTPDAFDADATLEPLQHLAHIVLEALE
jgi:hypothetical protein